MIEKLTKSVSMSSGEVTTEVAIAAFQALLKRRGLYRVFFENYINSRKVPIKTGWINEWINHIANGDPELWVIVSFVWKGTPQDEDVWVDLHNRWRRWCLENNVQKSISDLNSKK